MAIKNKTYYNFMRIKNILMSPAYGYDSEDASKLTHRVFENVEADRQFMCRPAEFFLGMILPKDEFESQQTIG